MPWGFRYKQDRGFLLLLLATHSPQLPWLVISSEVQTEAWLKNVCCMAALQNLLYFAKNCSIAMLSCLLVVEMKSDIKMPHHSARGLSLLVWVLTKNDISSAQIHLRKKEKSLNLFGPLISGWKVRSINCWFSGSLVLITSTVLNFFPSRFGESSQKSRNKREFFQLSLL